MNVAGAGRTVRTILGVLIVAVLAGDAAVVLSRQDDDAGRPSTAVTGDGDEAPATPEAKALEAALPELEAFVEQSRGLRFTSRPKVELLDDDEFEALLLETDEEAEAEAEVDEKAIVGLLRALGLIQGDIDLDEVGEQQVADVVGFYDDHTKRLYARGVGPTPYVKQVLVHELTHALEDQRFGLRRDELDDEASAAFTALVEGSATLVERRWFESRPAEEQEAIEAEEEAGGFGGGDVPAVFVRLMSFPYAVGPDFVDAVLAAGGQPRLDAAFAAPPSAAGRALAPAPRRRPTARSSIRGRSARSASSSCSTRQSATTPPCVPRPAGAATTTWRGGTPWARPACASTW
jgi:hypothetical protein